MGISEGIYEGLVTPSYKKPIVNNPTVMDSVGIIEENTPFQTLTLQRVGALESAVNDM